MSDELLIINGTVVCKDCFVPDAGVCIKDGRVHDIEKKDVLKKYYPDAELIDARGGLIMPGFINGHMHFYSTFARGLGLSTYAPNNFVDILDQLWWRLDKALSMDDVYHSALIPLIESVKSGTTTIFDHHASPRSIRGSLETIAGALGQIPVRASLCYEVSDRDGAKSVQAGLEENATFIRSYLGGERLTAMFGLHASMTISETTLKESVDLARDLGVGFHVHTAEDVADVNDCRKKYGMGVVERWAAAGVLGPNTILAHCVHIDDHEIDQLVDTGTFVVHNPESNMNNAVGVTDVVRMVEKGVHVGLGTDGMTSDMFQESKFSHLIQRDFQGDPKVGFAETGQLLFGTNPMMASNFFGEKLGTIEVGAPADLIVVDYHSPTPLDHDNFLGHFLYGMNSGMVQTTVVGGHVLMKNRELVGIDEDKIYAEARQKADELWKRI